VLSPLSDSSTSSAHGARNGSAPGWYFASSLAHLGHHLEAGQPVAERRLQRVEGGDGLAGTGDAEQRGGVCGRLRKQLQRGGGDQPELALGADEQVLHVQAAGVLAQRGQRVQQLPVRQYHLQPQRQLAHGAEAQHGEAAGVGGQVAADLAAAFAGQRQREQQPGAGRRRLHRRQRAAGLDGDGLVGRVEGANAVQPPQRDDQLPAAAVRRRRAAGGGVAALRHDGDVVGGAEAHQRCHFVTAGRQCHRQRRAVVAAAVVGNEGRDVVRRGQQVGGADNGGQRRKQIVHEVVSGSALVSSRSRRRWP
jgi:hypothetical protein